MESFLNALKAVAWAVLGVRKSKDREKDFENLNIIHIVIAGLIAFVLFIAVIFAAVHWAIPTDHS